MLNREGYEPPIAFMLIDTLDKTMEQIQEEINFRVADIIEKKLKEQKNVLNREDYKTMMRKLELERREIIKQFIFQIESKEEINRETMRMLEENERKSGFGELVTC